MKTPVSLCLLIFAFFGTSCSKASGDNNAETNTARSAESEYAKAVTSESPEAADNKSSSSPQDVVSFDGTNYIKKSGWNVPSRNQTNTENRKTDKRATENGKEVKMTTTHYIYKTPKLYSEDIRFEGSDLDYMKGKLKSRGFLEMSVNGRVFMFSVLAEKIIPPPTSNSDPHEDPFGYKIQDNDGDGIFETLIGGAYRDIIVPNWVLK